MASRIRGDQVFENSVQVLGPFTPRDGTITDVMVAAGAGLSASKLQQQYPLGVSQGSTGAVVARADIVHIARGAGSLVAVEAVVDTVADSTGLSVTVDIQKAAAGSTSWATMLSATAVFASTDADRTPKSATVGSTSISTYADGNMLRQVVTVAGSTGVQAQGLGVTAIVREAP